MAVLLGAVALAEFIAETIKLIRLDLRGNYVRTGGLMALMLALKVNQSVTRIDLDGEPKKEAVSSIVISVFHAVRYIKLEINKINWRNIE